MSRRGNIPIDVVSSVIRHTVCAVLAASVTVTLYRIEVDSVCLEFITPPEEQIAS